MTENARQFGHLVSYYTPWRRAKYHFQKSAISPAVNYGLNPPLRSPDIFASLFVGCWTRTSELGQHFRPFCNTRGSRKDASEEIQPGFRTADDNLCCTYNILFYFFFRQLHHRPITKQDSKKYIFNEKNFILFTAFISILSKGLFFRV